MADTRSRFKRPEQNATPTPGPDADRFVNAESPTPEAREAEPDADAQSKNIPQKPEPMKRLTIDIPESLHKRVKSQCGAQGTTIADVVRHYLEKKFPEPKI